MAADETDTRLSHHRVRHPRGRPLSVLRVVGKKRKGTAETVDLPVDLASRIGMPAALEPEALPEPLRRVDGPIEASRAGRPVMIGANEAAAAPVRAPLPTWHSGLATPADGRPAVIGLEEALAVIPAPPAAVEAPADAPPMGDAPLAPTVRHAPGAGEMDLVVTPLATPDDWHHFELALRRVRGVGPIRAQYYRAGILKVRVAWSGTERFAQALTRVPGYRVGILGEDRSTVQIRVGRA